MDITAILLTWLSAGIQGVMRIIWALFVRWWLGWIRGRIADAIIPSDFEVSVNTGVDPLKLVLRFKLHNGSASNIRLNRITAHLFCGGTAHVGSVVGTMSHNPFVDFSPESPKVGRGKSADISIYITPDIYLWFWLLPGGAYSLHSSSIEIQTNWGLIDVPLIGKITSQVGSQRRSIEEFRDRVRRALGISQ